MDKQSIEFAIEQLEKARKLIEDKWDQVVGDKDHSQKERNFAASGFIFSIAEVNRVIEELKH